jgi:diacylglycerol kinase family enzyme/membrane-associated phospholipid phosphatase
MPTIRLLAPINQLDLELFQRVAVGNTPALDKALPRLTRAANKSVLWFGIAGLLWAFGGRFGRRAAARGLLSIAISSPISNLAGKFLTRRPRPLLDDVPLLRQLPSAPTSTSFPSGHSSSAFAFATGAAMEIPYLGAPLGALATAVAYSRIHVGVHYPTDVLTGAMLGSAIALATRSFWPVAPSESTEAHHFQSIALEPRPTGEGVGIVVNRGAGSPLDDDAESVIRDGLPGAEIQVIDDEEGQDLTKALESEADWCEVLGISGGDGSISSAAQIAVDHKKTLMVIPGGTLNHLTRDLGLEDPTEAIEAVKKGEATAMDVATIDGKVFLNTASFGAYADLVDVREKLESKIGKWPALASALIRVLRRGQPVEVEIDGEQRKIWMIFIGNCRYNPSGFAPAWRKRLDDGQLDIRVVDASSRGGVTRLIASLFTGRLGRSRIYEQRLATRLEIKSLQGPLRLAHDGETFDGSEEFVVEKLSNPLTIYTRVR